MIKIKLYFTLVRDSCDSGKSVIKFKNIDYQDFLSAFKNCRYLYRVCLMALLYI